MDPNAVQVPLQHPGVCPVCHEPVAANYYFCPNCGAKVHEPPLSISPLMQLGIYAFSIILPMICFIAVTKWPGITYLRSKDEKTRQVGAIACGLLALSTCATLYYGYVWTEDALQQATTQLNQQVNSEMDE